LRPITRAKWELQRQAAGRQPGSAARRHWTGTRRAVLRVGENTTTQGGINPRLMVYPLQSGPRRTKAHLVTSPPHKSHAHHGPTRQSASPGNHSPDSQKQGRGAPGSSHSSLQYPASPYSVTELRDAIKRCPTEKSGGAVRRQPRALSAYANRNPAALRTSCEWHA
jgi:hypothetical protein